MHVKADHLRWRLHQHQDARRPARVNRGKDIAAAPAAPRRRSPLLPKSVRV